MPSGTLDLNPVRRITVGTIGQPGHRVFLLQASTDETTITVKLEKEQVLALAQGIETLLEELDEETLGDLTASAPAAEDLDLVSPADQDLVAGQLGLIFDESSRRLVLVVQEQLTGVEPEASPMVVHLWASAVQMKALCDHARDIAAQGRPICPLCQRPIDPEGHFCPKRNGHSKGSH